MRYSSARFRRRMIILSTIIGLLNIGFYQPVHDIDMGE